jgi:hypothetical protein
VSHSGVCNDAKPEVNSDDSVKTATRQTFSRLSSEQGRGKTNSIFLSTYLDLEDVLQASVEPSNNQSVSCPTARARR